MAIRRLAVVIGGKVRRVKTGGIYSVICRATGERDMTEVVVYRNEMTGQYQVMSEDEFCDGRFVAVID